MTAVNGEGDLVVIALSGVQRYIAESRSTADLNAASSIVARLATHAAGFCAGRGRVVFPSTTSGSVDGPNRIVVLTDPGEGASIAEEAAAAVRSQWSTWVEEVLGRPADTPGMPSVQWVVAPANLGDYATRWAAAGRTMGARRRVRDFDSVSASGGAESRRKLCALSPRWLAEDIQPAGLRRHERDTLSAANWVKRRWSTVVNDDHVARFPSTPSIASAPYRGRLLERLGDDAVREAGARLRAAATSIGRFREVPVRGLPDPAGADPDLGDWVRRSAGPWVYPDAWQPEVVLRELRARQPDATVLDLCRRGAKAARDLAALLREPHEREGPTSYLALVLQDIDRLGKFLSGTTRAEDGTTRLAVEADVHDGISRTLVQLGKDQRRTAETDELLGVPVYAGGDDLLTFMPAVKALAAARMLRELKPKTLPTVSTAVVFFHRHSSLRRALGEARTLLHECKAALGSRHVLGVTYLRRSGSREVSMQPWQQPGASADRSAATLFGVFGGTARAQLSPALVTDLERAKVELSTLPDELYRAELARLVVRHGGCPEDADLLADLGMYELTADPDLAPGAPHPVPAAKIAAFCRRECR